MILAQDKSGTNRSFVTVKRGDDTRFVMENTANTGRNIGSEQA